jgi:arylsulfatase A-like enzyme
MSMTRPNIVYLHSHDTGRYVQPYGHAVPTPSIQRLAEEGVLFRQAFSAGPTCSPSRAGLLTGQSPHAAGLLGLVHRGFRLNDPRQHLATVLRDGGYRTALLGFQHVTAGDPSELGYTDLIEPDACAIASIVPKVARFLDDHLAHQPEQPFFLDAGAFETHRVYPEVPAEAGRYVRPPAPIPDAPETRHDMARFIESARRLDEGYGRILDLIDRAGIRDNTIVVCTTDHGLAFPGMKCTLTDHGIGVLLIVRGPGGFEGGQVSDALVSQIDLMPTLCELAEIELPAWATGKSLLPLVRGEVEAVNEEIFAEVTYHAAYEPQRVIRTGRYSYIRRWGNRTTPVLPNIDDGESKSWLLERGLADRAVPAEQLYDLVFDPNQANNLIGDPRMGQIRTTLGNRLRGWMEETNDPLLAGDVPLPAGASVNDADARSAGEGLRSGGNVPI